jgi:hypothetical protein
MVASVFGLALASSAQAALLVSEQDVHLSYDTSVPIGAQPQVHITGTATAPLDVYVSTISATDRCSGEFPSSWQVDRTYLVQPGDIDMTYVGSTQTAPGPIRLCVWVYDRWRLKAADAAAKAIPESCAGHADVNAA